MKGTKTTGRKAGISDLMGNTKHSTIHITVFLEV